MSDASKKRNTKKRGRPATGQDPIYSVRLPKVLMDGADEWATARMMTRSQAIRRWVENGIVERWWPPGVKRPRKPE